MDFQGRCVYVSGGSSGIGLAAARLFSSKGADVFIFSIDDKEAMEKALSEIEGAKLSDTQRFDYLKLDVSDEKAVAEKLASAADSFGSAYVIINSAGIGGAVYFEKLSYERFDATMKINLYGTRNVIATLLPSMKNGGGYIVNVSSFSGLVGIVGYTAYASSKFAVVGFSQSLRAELKRDGITVSVMCPPQVDTPLLVKTDPDKPPETKAINDRAGMLSAQEVAEYMFRAMMKKEFLIIPGAKAKFFHLFNRLLPTVRERITNRIVDKVRKNLGS
jgi:3-dehydrosphinganine reductase